MDLTNLVILVTGASRGLGKTLCKMLYKNNAKVIGIYNETKINEEFLSYKCDISNECEVSNLKNIIENKFNKIDVLINCAALSLDNDIYEKDIDEFMKVIKVNLGGTFLMCKYFSLIMDGGKIINISSTNGEDTYNTLSMDYDASKAGVNNLTKNLANRFNNIKVIALEPNWINTESVLDMEPKYLENELKRIKQVRLLEKEEVCEKIIELIKDNDISSGSIIRMDGLDE